MKIERFMKISLLYNNLQTIQKDQFIISPNYWPKFTIEK